MGGQRKSIRTLQRLSPRQILDDAIEQRDGRARCHAHSHRLARHALVFGVRAMVCADLCEDLIRDCARDGDVEQPILCRDRGAIRDQRGYCRGGRRGIEPTAGDEIRDRQTVRACLADPNSRKRRRHALVSLSLVSCLDRDEAIEGRRTSQPG